MTTILHILGIIGIVTDVVILIGLIWIAATKKSTRYITLSNIKPDEEILIYYGSRITNAIVKQNYPKQREMLVFIKGILPDLLQYDSQKFNNFDSLNPARIPQKETQSPELIKYGISQQLEQAIKEEDYTKAAKLRDQLKKIK